uniref:Uncharacterized protein n=1 Tax=Populus trichocarpa TaxID=3694 RepID=A9PC39_POPTR|nr:unknown [Populus trichocarpa]
MARHDWLLWKKKRKETGKKTKNSELDPALHQLNRRPR